MNSDQRSVARWLPIIAAIVVFVVLAWSNRFTFDDGFINFRIVKQIEAGNGPVFNIGERVEAFTSAGWLLVLLVGDLLTPLPIEWLAVVLGITLSVVGLLAGVDGAHRLWPEHRRPDPFFVPLGLIAFVAIAPNWWFATSGLEGGLTVAWIGLSIRASARALERDGSCGWGTWVLLGAGWLVRPELAIASLVVVATLVMLRPDGETVRHRIAVSSTAWILPGVYEVFRAGYYGELLPNTALAKSAFETRWGTGWEYLHAYATRYWLWVPAMLTLVAGAAVLARRTRLTRAQVLRGAWVGAGVLMAIYVVRVGGDYIPARLLLAPTAIVALAFGTVPVRSSPQRFALAVGLGWCAFALLVLRPVAYQTVISDPRRNVVTVQQAVSGIMGPALQAARSAPLTVELRPVPGGPGGEARNPTAALTGVGVLGYALGTDYMVWDLGGLADPVAAHFALTRRTLPGHEKFLPAAWVAGRLTRSDVSVPSSLVESNPFLVQPLIPTTSGAQFDEQVRDVRAVMQCRTLVDLQRSYRSPLTLHRFVTNLIDSPANTRLEIPPDPAVARRRFCGSSGSR